MRLLVSLFFSVVSVFFLNPNADAATSLGAGYKCSGKTITTGKGKAVAFSTAKQSLNSKISSLRSQIASAKKKNQNSKVNSLTKTLNNSKSALDKVKQCNKGSFLSTGGGKPEKPERPGKPVRPGRPTRR